MDAVSSRMLCPHERHVPKDAVSPPMLCPPRMLCLHCFRVLHRCRVPMDAVSPRMLCSIFLN